ncbi:hypothetical protein BegalDRAFT_0502 [Beggiatoa alba B18LD]|uniref:Nucleotidyltransferase family protein n=1 Tax=Beggiatoa alba B18LD TaxID=395493 RepID=I3CCS7_9GAMM|nr:nucleotidyltransferase family protein [Beggiatoa alba]EIJ41420.1 hypothetical protein BegalDRAFT_0502 [Beggiatoa alba B18LD]
MSVEFQLLCQAHQPDKLAQLLNQTIAWQTVLKLTDRHRVAPQLYQSLKNNNLIPNPIRQALRTRYEKNTLRAMRNLVTIQTLLQSFTQHNIPCIVLKGIGLALQLYGNIGARHAGDIDLLIDPQHLRHVDTLLQQQGYQRIQPAFSLTEAQFLKIQQLWNQFEYYHPQGQCYLDIHWRLSYNHHLCPIPFNELYQQHQTIYVQTQALPVLAPLHNLLYLSAHGSQHVWGCLFWLWDIATLLQQTTFDWDKVITNAQHIGCLPSLIQGIHLAHHLLNSPLPDTLPPYQQQTRYKRLQQAGERYLQLPIPIPLRTVLWQRFYYDLQLNSSWAYRRELLQHIFLHPHDWQALPLPPVLFPLYYVIGSILWLKRQLIK